MHVPACAAAAVNHMLACATGVPWGKGRVHANLQFRYRTTNSMTLLTPTPLSAITASPNCIDIRHFDSGAVVRMRQLDAVPELTSEQLLRALDC